MKKKRNTNSNTNTNTDNKEDVYLELLNPPVPQGTEIRAEEGSLDNSSGNSIATTAANSTTSSNTPASNNSGNSNNSDNSRAREAEPEGEGKRAEKAEEHRDDKRNASDGKGLKVLTDIKRKKELGDGNTIL